MSETKPTPADMARDLAADLRELEPPDGSDALLGSFDTADIAVAACRRALAAEDLLRRLVEVSDYGVDCDDVAGMLMGVACEAKRHLEAKP